MTSNVDSTLGERGARYGEFHEHALIAQNLKGVMRQMPGWARLRPDQKEALEMIQHKIARVLNGDPDYADSWHDIAGYARLVEKRLTVEWIGDSNREIDRQVYGGTKPIDGGH